VAAGPATHEKIARAAQLLQRGATGEAALLLGDVTAAEPQNGEALNLLGIALAQRGDTAGAIDALARAVALLPDHAGARANYANALRLAGRLEEAVAQYRTAIALKPDSRIAYRQLGAVSLDLGDVPAAIANFRQAAARDAADADAWLGLGRAELAARNFTAAADAFGRAARLNPSDASPFLGRAQAARGLGNAAAALYDLDQALARRADDAEALTLRAAIFREQGKRVEALADCERALAAEPANWRLLNNRGVLLDELGRADEAVVCFERSLTINPDNPDALQNIGTAMVALGRGPAAVAKYDAALAADPRNAGVLNAKGAVLIAMRRFEEAVGAFDRALALQPASAVANFHRAFALLALGRYEEGFAAYEWRRRSATHVFTPPSLGAPELSERADVRGKTLLLVGEQGIGDIIQFSRFARRFADDGAKVVLQVYPALVPLLESLGGGVSVIASDGAAAPADFACPLLSAPHKLGTTLSTVPSRTPYLAPPPTAAAAWRARVGALRPGLRVGLAWSGNPQYANDSARSIAFATLRPLIETGGAVFVNVQRDVRAGDEEALAAAGVADFRTQLGDFGETAGLVSALDLVISVDTSLAHLAGALGKPVWILLSAVADWRWLEGRSDSPWYPTARLFRQRKLGDWTEVVDEAAIALRQLVRERGLSQ
jgi:tetratricopeptide (TPR) repeat protein